MRPIDRGVEGGREAEWSPVIQTRAANLTLTAINEAQTPLDPSSREAGSQKFTWNTQTKAVEQGWLNNQADNTAGIVPVVCVASGMIC